MMTTRLTDERIARMRRAAAVGVETLDPDGLAYFHALDIIALADECTAARAANERDRAAYHRAVTSIRAWGSRWWGMATSRGAYAWDDDEYRREFQRAIGEAHTIADRLERNAHTRDRADCPTTQAEVDAALAAAGDGAGCADADAPTPAVPSVSEGSDG